MRFVLEASVPENSTLGLFDLSDYQEKIRYKNKDVKYWAKQYKFVYLQN